MATPKNPESGSIIWTVLIYAAPFLGSFALYWFRFRVKVNDERREELRRFRDKFVDFLPLHRLLTKEGAPTCSRAEKEYKLYAELFDGLFTKPPPPNIDFLSRRALECWESTRYIWEQKIVEASDFSSYIGVIRPKEKEHKAAEEMTLQDLCKEVVEDTNKRIQELDGFPPFQLIRSIVSKFFNRHNPSSPRA